MSKRGFSLLELMVVIAIIATLLAMGTINFSNWQKKYSVEKQTKELFADISQLRLKAMHTKQLHRLTIKKNAISCLSYSPEDETLSAGTTVLAKTLRYTITEKDGSALPASGVITDFDFRGYTNNLSTIRIASDTKDAPFDCILISNARTNLGKMNGETCDAK